MPAPPDPSRGFTGIRPTFSLTTYRLETLMLDLVFVVLGAVLFLGALVYARACANV